MQLQFIHSEAYAGFLFTISKRIDEAGEVDFLVEQFNSNGKFVGNKTSNNVMELYTWIWNQDVLELAMSMDSTYQIESVEIDEVIQ